MWLERKKVISWVIKLPIPYYPVVVLYQFIHRKSFANRDFQLPVAIGVTNEVRAYGKSMHTWFIDVDKPKLIRELIPKSILIVKTTKGYHYYLDILEPTFMKAMKAAYRYHKTYGDMGQLRLALRRDYLFIIRVGGKYFEPLTIEYERNSEFAELEAWKKHVVNLILKLNNKD